MKRIFETDAYIQNFSAVVKEIQEKEGTLHMRLDQTAFYPGGGGQDCDTGTISGKSLANVEEVYEADNEIWHVCTATGPFSVGDRVEARLNWEARYTMMKSHTAEHVLFRTLMNYFEGIEMVKVHVTQEGTSLTVKYPGSLSSELTLDAEKKVGLIISKGLDISIKEYPKDSVPEGTRVKLESITGEMVRVIEVGDYDRCACAGLHIKNTSEIGTLTITNVTSERAGTYKISFLVGEQAQIFLLETKKACDRACTILRTTSDKLEKTMVNLKEQKEKLEAVVKDLNDQILDELEPAKFKDHNFYSKVLSGMDNNRLMEKAGELIKTGRTVVLFGNKEGSKAFIVLAKSPDSWLDIKELSEEIFPMMNGKGGGKDNFISGAGEADKLGETFGFAEEKIGEKLMA